MKKLNFLDVVIFLFAFLFIYAALNKLMTYDEFVAQIGKSPLITKHVWWISWLIPSLELIIAFLLFVPRFQLLALYASFTLMFMFSAYIYLILNYSPYVPCSCGGILDGMGWEQHLVFNLGFTLLAVVGVVLHNKQNRMKDQQLAMA